MHIPHPSQQLSLQILQLTTHGILEGGLQLGDFGLSCCLLEVIVCVCVCV